MARRKPPAKARATPLPPIDVLMPVFNGETWLRQSVRSLQQQTHPALRIHVVDDGSTDSTPAILASLAKHDERIRVHRQANGGIVDALNHGLRHCEAEWVARHDADDIAHPQRLQLQRAYLDAHPDCVAVGAMARHIDAAGRALGTVTRLRPPELADAGWLPAREPYLMHPMLMVRRQPMLAVGGYRSVVNSEDSDLYWRLREHGRLHNLSEVLGDYRVHGSSVSSRSIQNGRVMAVSSQLAALSAQRRQAGRADLDFDPARAVQMRAAARSLESLVEQAEVDLTAAERQRFALAVATKLLELASYQPYELDAGDCAFVGRTIRRSAAVEMHPENRRSLAVDLTRTAVRLAAGKRWRDAIGLLPVGLLPQFAARYAVQTGLPVAARRRLRLLRVGRVGRSGTP